MTPLSADQIDEIAGAIEGHPRNRSLQGRIDRTALGQALNDLLRARGLAISPKVDPDGLFPSGRQGRADRLVQEAFLREAFQEIGSRTKNLIALLGTDGRDHHLRQAWPVISLEIPPNAATLSVTHRILVAMHEQLRGLDTNTSTGAPRATDALTDHMSALLESLALVRRRLRSPTVFPQLNASLRLELIRTGNVIPGATGHGVRSVDVDFDTCLAHLRAIATCADTIARFHDSRVVRNRPKDELLEGILPDLAEIYLVATSSDRPRSSLAASMKSPFVGFCIDVLRHYFPEEHVSMDAIAKRWQRLKRAEY